MKVINRTADLVTIEHGGATCTLSTASLSADLSAYVEGWVKGNTPYTLDLWPVGAAHPLTISPIATLHLMEDLKLNGWNELSDLITLYEIEPSTLGNQYPYFEHLQHRNELPARELVELAYDGHGLRQAWLNEIDACSTVCAKACEGWATLNDLPDPA
jgi:hypothetical protein